MGSAETKSAITNSAITKSAVVGPTSVGSATTGSHITHPPPLSRCYCHQNCGHKSRCCWSLHHTKACSEQNVEGNELPLLALHTYLLERVRGTWLDLLLHLFHFTVSALERNHFGCHLGRGSDIPRHVGDLSRVEAFGQLSSLLLFFGILSLCSLVCVLFGVDLEERQGGWA